jgi:hypothetical protein
LETACLRGGVLLLMTANDTKSHITRKDGPRWRRTIWLTRLTINQRNAEDPGLADEFRKV